MELNSVEMLQADLELMIEKYNDLAEQFANLVDVTEELTKRSYGALFTLPSGYGIFEPIFADPEKFLSKIDEKPIKMNLNFSPDMLTSWITLCAEQVKEKE